MAIDVKEWGTFKDSLKAPVYRWFTYPAGFSYKAVEYSIQSEGLHPGDTVYDPFMGTGTTNLAAKTMGINSYGVEAHPFVYPIAKCKLNWDINPNEVMDHLGHIRDIVNADTTTDEESDLLNKNEFPELVIKCYLPRTLHELHVIRDYILNVQDSDVKLFLKVALISTLREVSIAATGWPYIAPNKIKITSLSKDGIGSYINAAEKMLEDLSSIRFTSEHEESFHTLIHGDSRSTVGQIPDESVDHIFTSPPYLNNFDYADRTRLEMYFMGDAKNWGDICASVRTKLITSATTQINRSDSKYTFREDFIKDCPEEYAFLKDAVEELGKRRLTKGGKKSYDLLVVGYMNDLYLILKDCFRVLRPGKTAKFILGDSAPYGVHIPTDELIGQIGVRVGFTSYSIEELRTRGDKWKENPQRHNVKLRETIVILKK